MRDRNAMVLSGNEFDPTHFINKIKFSNLIWNHFKSMFIQFDFKIKIKVKSNLFDHSQILLKRLRLN